MNRCLREETLRALWLSRLNKTAGDAVPPDLDLLALEQRLNAWESGGITVLSVVHPGYPDNLRSISGRPPLLFVRGALTAADSWGVAIVGTREASYDGLKRAARLARELAGRGVTVYSGLARGIDTAAHRGALAGGGRTVAVIGTGVNRFYPAENRELQSHIAEQFAVVSQFHPDEGPRRHTFPRRNAVMSAMSRASVIVEAGETSGARLQAQAAVRQGRPVLLMASMLDRFEWARQFALKSGVTICRSTDDVIEALSRPD